ncbi:MAG TPA: GAF domain-containing protein [Solirubrobacteraceae bacterium]|nr:GAF domain-containing protein [Solirubrobacteraceae bacterium]
MELAATRGRRRPSPDSGRRSPIRASLLELAWNRLAGGGDPRDNAAIRPNRLDDVVARRRFRGVWTKLRAGVNHAVVPMQLHGRRLRAEREAERIFELSPALLAVAGLDGYLRRINPAFEVFGYSREEWLSRPWTEFAHPSDRERTLEAAESLERGIAVDKLDVRVVCRDGSLRWVEWSTRVVPEEGLIFAAGRDVTESRHAAEEQAALRRVATLVAQEATPDAVFAAVVREVGEVLAVEATHLGRYDSDGTVVSVAHWGTASGVEVGARFPLDGDNVSVRVLRSASSARMDGYEEAHGVIAETIRQAGIRFSIGVPISVHGRTWGVMIATSKDIPFPAETEARLQGFTELVATAISNANAHDEVRILADEQAALRRVATLVAKQAPQGEVFATIAEQIGGLLAVDSVHMVRYEEGVAAIVASWGTLAQAVPIGARMPLGGRNIASIVCRTKRAARLDDYGDSSGRIAQIVTAGGVRSAVGTPIVVEGRLWGAMVAASTHDERLPADTELRIGQFTELMATAIANAEARAEVARLAEEQAALRRVATLVAEGPSPAAVFDAVSREVAAVLNASAVSLVRYDDDVITVVAEFGTAHHLRLGERFALGGTNVTTTVLRTGATARLDDVTTATGPIGDAARRAGVRSTVGAPVIVDGRTWGVLAAVWTDREPPPDDTGQRMAGFAELLDTAIAKADSRDQLTASRARLLAAGDDARRRVVRDLHDGAQQRLVHTIVTLKLAQQALHENRGDIEPLLADALRTAELATHEVRELAHGILPSVLTHGGLRDGVDAFVSRLDLPVDFEVLSERLPPDIEASAYFIIAEALTNVVKHARATRATVRAAADNGVLALEVRDDGIGGAQPDGHGLMGIADRIETLGGRLRIESADGDGTVLAAQLPLSTRWPRESDAR